MKKIHPAVPEESKNVSNQQLVAAARQRQQLRQEKEDRRARRSDHPMDPLFGVFLGRMGPSDVNVGL